MNDEACSVFRDLINLAVRMMPIFVCMEPKHKNKENIAAVSAYLWVLMVSMESVFHIDPRAFLTFRGLFSCLSHRFLCEKNRLYKAQERFSRV